MRMISVVCVLLFLRPVGLKHTQPGSNSPPRCNYIKNTPPSPNFKLLPGSTYFTSKGELKNCFGTQAQQQLKYCTAGTTTTFK